MHKKSDNEVKKNLAAGASGAAGAAAGIAIGAAVTADEAEAAVPTNPEPTIQHTTTPGATHHHHAAAHQESSSQHVQEPPVGQTPPPEPPHEDPDDPDVEVLSYERVTNDDGSQMDLAVLEVNGNEVGVVDTNLDGQANLIMSDLNHDNVIEAHEIEDVTGQGIAMRPFADAAGFNSELVQNDLPDYVNDANIDSYV